MAPRSLLSATLLAVCLAPAAWAAPPEPPGSRYQDRAAHFDFPVPPGWDFIPPDMMANLNKIAQFNRLNAQFSGGLWRPNKDRFLDPPYLVVQIRPLDSWIHTYDDVRAAIKVETGGRIVETRPDPPASLKGLRAGDLFLDTTNKRVVAVLEEPAVINKPKPGAPMDIEREETQIREVCVAFLGSRHMVLVHYYDRVNGFDARLAPFDDLVRNFHFDEGAEFRPGAVRVGATEEKNTDMPTAAEKRAENLRFGATMALVLGVMCALFVWRMKVGSVLPVSRQSQGEHP